MKSVSDWDEDDHRNIRYYSDLVNRFGEDIRAMDWSSRESQHLRFAVLSGIGQLHGTSILDVGCGQADLLAWLRQTGRDVNYRGIDITPAMINVARNRFPDAHFEVRDLLRAPLGGDSIDYVLCSGVFTYRQKEPVKYLEQLVIAMYTLCCRGVAFNCLSTWSPIVKDGEFHADPVRTLDLCRSLTPYVTLRHSYHPRDFTVYLYRNMVIN